MCSVYPAASRATGPEIAPSADRPASSIVSVAPELQTHPPSVFPPTDGPRSLPGRSPLHSEHSLPQRVVPPVCQPATLSQAASNPPSQPPPERPPAPPCDRHPLCQKFDDVLKVLCSPNCEHLPPLESDEIPVKGRLKRHISFWKSIPTSPMILSAIEEGYRIPFIQQPPSMFFPNNRSALRQATFVTKSILQLLDSGRVTELSTPAYVNSPLSVATSASKRRLILDLVVLIATSKPIISK